MDYRTVAVASVLTIFAAGVTLSNNINFSPLETENKTPETPFDHPKRVEGPISFVIESNLSLNSDGYYVRIPKYQIETNSKGLREESFSAQKPEDVTRILFLGDSFTFGWGVNSSDRFSDIVERKLNNRSSTRYQAINAGIPGYGMEDNLIFFRERGIGYEPDIVVVSYSAEDMLSTKKSKYFRELAENRTPSGKESKITEKELSLTSKYLRKTSVEDSNLSEHMATIDRLAEKNGIQAIFFEIGTISREEKQFYKYLERSKNITLVYPPEQFEQASREEFTISEKDPHFNVLGHRWLANKLYGYLNHRFEQ